MFHSAALKLTAWYLGIIMAISIIFSLSLYHVSSNDLEGNVNRQIGYFSNLIGPDESSNYGVLRERQLRQDLGNLKSDLFFFNLLVLIAGGIASYGLARRTLRPIEEALDTQTRFASDASHELRTPLTAIQAENEVALRDSSLTKAKAVSLLKSNLEEVAKLKLLAEGLLRLASNGGMVTETQPVALKAAADQAIARYHKAAAGKRIKITNRAGGQRVKGDPDSLVELISIFIDNSIKYSPSGSEVVITSFKQNKLAGLRVSDQGPGIKQTELPHIFERFYRSDSSRNKAAADGYGLGLAIAKKIAEAHHGYIEVSSTLGKGTTFTSFLPAA